MDGTIKPPEPQAHHSQTKLHLMKQHPNTLPFHLTNRPSEAGHPLGRCLRSSAVGADKWVIMLIIAPKY